MWLTWGCDWHIQIRGLEMIEGDGVPTAIDVYGEILVLALQNRVGTIVRLV